MSEPWAAENELTAEQARQLIEGQFPELSPATVVPFRRGWDNVAFRVNDDWVFRFPRRQLGAECMESEIKVLPKIAAAMPVPIPNPEFIGRPTPGYPWPFAGYRFLRGTTACAASRTDEQRSAAATTLATFLRRLHSLPLADLIQNGALPDLYGRLDLARRIPQTRQRLEEIRKAGLLQDVTRLEHLIGKTQSRFGDANFASGPASVLLHGDLYVRHLLVDDTGELCGVIDWGDVHYGVPANDLMIAHSFLPPAAHLTFREAYGPIDDETWQLARFRALNHATVLLLYAASVSDETLLRAALTSMRYLQAG